jgi:hypothetical protein
MNFPDTQTKLIQHGTALNQHTNEQTRDEKNTEA